MDKLDKSYNRIRLYFAMETLIFFLTLPISFPIFHILNYFHLVNEIYTDALSESYYKCYNFIFKKNEEMKHTITFMVSYIKFVSYLHDYSFW